MSDDKRALAIVGAGVAGLSAALRVVRAPELDRAWSVQLFEASARVGGLVRSERVGDVVLDAGPDGVVASKPRAAALCREVGLGNELIETDPASRSVYVLHHGALEPMPRGMFLAVPTELASFLRSPLLSRLGRLRALGDLVLPRKRDASPETVSAFLTRRFGAELAALYGPSLLAGIYAGDPDALELEACFPQLSALERSHRSLVLGARARAQAALAARKGRPAPSAFLSLRQGMEALPLALATALGPERVRTQRPVRALTREGAHWTLHFDEGVTHRADRVLLCVPPTVAARLLEPLDTRAADALFAVPTVDTAIVLFVFERAAVGNALRASGLVAPHGAGGALTACTFLSSKWPGRAPADKVVLRAFFGHAREQHTPRLDDAALTRLALAELGPVLGLRGAPALTRVVRFRGASPQMVLGHAARVALAGSALAPQGVGLTGGGLPAWGIPDTITNAESAVATLLAR